MPPALPPPPHPLAPCGFTYCQDAADSHNGVSSPHLSQIGGLVLNCWLGTSILTLWPQIRLTDSFPNLALPFSTFRLWMTPTSAQQFEPETWGHSIPLPQSPPTSNYTLRSAITSSRRVSNDPASVDNVLNE